MRLTSLLSVVFFGIYCLSTPTKARGADWTWKDHEGNIHTRADLDLILKKHESWVQNIMNEVNGLQPLKDPGERANLAGADLQAADLPGANFFGAYLSNANFNGANLKEAIFANSDIEKASFEKADLTKASFEMKTKAHGADFRDAHLDHVIVMGTDFSNASFVGASMVGIEVLPDGTEKAENGDGFVAPITTTFRNADFRAADLSEAWFWPVDFTGTTFEPAKPPPASGFHMVLGLGHLGYYLDSGPIYKLRKSFEDGGFEYSAKEVTASIRRIGQNTAEKILFDWTCEWGLNWLRPVKIIVAIFALCIPVYWSGLHRRGGGAIFVMTSKLEQRSATPPKFIRIVAGLPPSPPEDLELLTEVDTDERLYIGKGMRPELLALGYATLFSLLSSVNLGYHEFNFGQWIKMVLPYEMEMRSQGWVRTVAGIQSLLGLVLLALALLCYFGHPFQ